MSLQQSPTQRGNAGTRHVPTGRVPRAAHSIVLRGVTFALATLVLAAPWCASAILATACALFAGVIAIIAPRGRNLTSMAVVALVVLGCGVGMRLEVGPASLPTAVWLATLLSTAAVLAAACYLLTVRIGDRLILVLSHNAVPLLTGLLLLRLAPLAAGRDALETGRLGFLQVGEFTRPLILLVFAAGIWRQWQVKAPAPDLRAGAAARTAPRSWWRCNSVGVCAAANVALLVLARDFGPALLTAAGLIVAAAAHYPRRPRWRRRPAWVWLLSAATAAVLVGIALLDPVIRQRLTGVFQPQSDAQLRGGLLTAAWGGLIGDGSNAYAPHLAVVASDMLPAAAIGYVGALPYAAAIAVLLAGLAGMLVRADAARPSARPAALALTAVLALTVVWTCLANVALAALTGLSMPFLCVTGSAIIPTTASFAIVCGLVHGSHRRPAMSRPVRRLSLFLSPTAALIAAAGALVTVLSPASPDDVDLAPLPRGGIVTADGAAVTSAVDGRPRLVSPIYAEVGTVERTDRGVASYGVPSMQVHTQTCGGKTGVIDKLVRRSRCVPSTIVLTLDSKIQQAAAQALAGQDGEAVVMDANTGGLLALYATGDTAPTVAVSRGGTNSIARNGGNAPGSVFTVITATAAALTGVSSAGAPLDRLRFPDGGDLRNEDGFVCPSDAMELALAYSCNTVLGRVGDRLGGARLQQVAHDYFGFDTEPAYAGIPDTYDGGRFTSATTGLSPAEYTNAGVVARTSLGLQDVHASVVNLAEVGAVLSAKGHLAPAPHIVAGSCDSGIFSASREGGTVAQRPVPAAALTTILDGMRDAARFGTARSLAHYLPDIAAKTGTADVTLSNGRPSTDETVIALRSHYVIAVVVHLGELGSSDAAVRVVDDLVPALDHITSRRPCR